jgi:hypothetical protein
MSTYTLAILLQLLKALALILFTLLGIDTEVKFFPPLKASEINVIVLGNTKSVTFSPFK